MDTQTTPAPTEDDPPLGVPVDVHFIVEEGAGSLVLAAVGADTLEIPLSRQDAVQLIAALAEYAYPGCRSADGAGGRACLTVGLDLHQNPRTVAHPHHRRRRKRCARDIRPPQPPLAPITGVMQTARAHHSF